MAKIVDEWVEVSSIGRGIDANREWGDGRAAVRRSALGDLEHRRPRLRDRSRRSPRRPGLRARFPAKLAKLLARPLSRGRAPLTLLPCELIVGNGDKLRAAVLGVLDTWEAREGAPWSRADCVWVNSLVDRIVSEPLEPVGAVAEPYALWAIEDQPGLNCRAATPRIVITDDLAAMSG